jgi:hypothetical protein
MSWNIPNLVFVSALLCGLPSTAAKPNVSQSETRENVRKLTFKAAPAQPEYTLHIAASGAQGIVKVIDAAGTLQQTLTCPLDPSQVEAASRQFIERFTAEDLDLDRYLDLRGTRSFGAKWNRDCVWLYDPQNHTFYQDLLSQHMEALSNLTVDTKRQRIVSYSIGPVNPLWDEYRIERTGKNRPYWARLIPVKSCFIDTDGAGTESGSPNKFTLVITRYENGRSVVERHAMTSGDKTGMDTFCGALNDR